MRKIRVAGSQTIKDDRPRTSFGDRDLSEAATPNADELAKSLAMMQAALESTPDAILITNESNQVEGFSEKYIKLWNIPSDLKASRNARDFWNHLSLQQKGPAAYLKRVGEIMGSRVRESFDL